MQAEYECTECKNEFPSASLLLKHFASHAISNERMKSTLTEFNKRNIPDLYPINISKDQKVCDKTSSLEDVNPITFCLATLEERDISDITKKYQCSYCQKRFGWSTDLKRHILIHTGERPFGCKFCGLDFTRKFLLQRHEKKIHSKEFIPEMMPELKPIYVKKKS